MSNETKLQSAIIDALNTAGYHPMRNNSGAMKRRYVVGLGPGSADIILCINGQFVALEVKDGSDQSSAQKSWQAEIEGDGGMYFLVTSVREAMIAVLSVPGPRPVLPPEAVSLSVQRRLAICAAEKCKGVDNE